MVNKREIRISIFYFTLIAIMIFTIYIMKITGFVDKGSGTTFTVLTGILMAFLLLSPIVCLIAVIYHLIKAFSFPKEIEGKKQYIIWEYDKRLWRNFILSCIKININDDLKSFGKFGIKFIPISLITIILYIVLNPKRTEYLFVYLSIPFGIFLIYFLWVMGRNMLKALDHLIFSDYIVILMKSGAIFNGEYIDWDIEGESRLVEKKIIDGYIDIKYCVRARSNSRFQNLKDIKRLKIPIPTEKFNEAESYLSEDFKAIEAYKHPLRQSSGKGMLGSKVKTRTNSKKAQRNNRIISIFVVIQTAILFSSFLIYILSHNTIIHFYALTISYTIMSIMMFEMVFVFIYSLVKSQRIKDKAFAIGMVCLFALVGVFIALWTSKYYKDVPYVINKEYKMVVGECTYVYADYGRTSHLDMTVGNIEFNVSLGYKDSIKMGDVYKVFYLPNTKEVFEIYGGK